MGGYCIRAAQSYPQLERNSLPDGAFMDLKTLTALLLLLSLFALFWRGRGVRELACRHALERCRREGVQLLDDQVAFVGWRWLKNSQGSGRLVRRYQFEFSSNGVDRHRGSLAMDGRQLVAIKLAPYPTQFMGENSTDIVPEASDNLVQVDFKQKARR